MYKNIEFIRYFLEKILSSIPKTSPFPSNAKNLVQKTMLKISVPRCEANRYYLIAMTQLITMRMRRSAYDLTPVNMALTDGQTRRVVRTVQG